MGFTCSASDLTLDNVVVTWYMIEKYQVDKVMNGKMNEFKSKKAQTISGKMKGQLFITNVEVTDSGLYYCKMNQTWGLGTELQVFSTCVYKLL